VRLDDSRRVSNLPNHRVSTVQHRVPPLLSISYNFKHARYVILRLCENNSIMLSSAVNVWQWLDDVSEGPCFDLKYSANASPVHRPQKRKFDSPVMNSQERLHFDATPRAPRPTKKARSYTGFGPTPPASFPPSACGDTYSTASSPSQQSRSSSPTKRKRALETSTPKVILEQRSALRHQRVQLEKGRPLLESLLAAIGAANKHLPKGLQDYFDRTHELEDGPLPPFATNPSLDRFSSMEKFLHKTIDHVSLCKRASVSEDEWCDLVVYPCLKAAAKYIGASPAEVVIRVTNYQIHPPRMLPKDSFNHPLTCHADFALGHTCPSTPQLTQNPDHSFSQ
jgi:hypothetical protein